MYVLQVCQLRQSKQRTTRMLDVMVENEELCENIVIIVMK